MTKTANTISLPAANVLKCAYRMSMNADEDKSRKLTYRIIEDIGVLYYNIRSINTF